MCDDIISHNTAKTSIKYAINVYLLRVKADLTSATLTDSEAEQIQKGLNFNFISKNDTILALINIQIILNFTMKIKRRQSDFISSLN